MENIIIRMLDPLFAVCFYSWKLLIIDFKSTTGKYRIIFSTQQIYGGNYGYFHHFQNVSPISFSYSHTKDNVCIYTLKYWFLSSQVKSAFLVMPLVTVVLCNVRFVWGLSWGFIILKIDQRLFFLDLKKTINCFSSHQILTSSI